MFVTFQISIDKISLLFVDKLTSVLEAITRSVTRKAESTIKWQYTKQCLPPYFLPKDLEEIFTVQCQARDEVNKDSFDENFNGFTLILFYAVIEMLNVPTYIVDSLGRGIRF